ncbi:ATP-binding protein [uncultured Litoreibacter sp.]|uniref:ATP-binding protein n=1 Tax=uncultured Litoreibacter sp. TaxID=1392394 RepID=UPI00260DC908|nr:ATP-binding protein [uncultured Litoreibacter sp.]
MIRLPEKEAVLRQENITIRDLPARSGSVMAVIGLSAFHLPWPFLLLTVVAYLAIELWGILAVQRIAWRMTWWSYLNLLVAACVGSMVFLRVPYEMWHLDGLTPKLFAFCTLTTALIHCASVRAYHLPLAVVTGGPVVVTIALTVVSDVMSEALWSNVGIGLAVLALMVGYITVMMVDNRRSKQILIDARDSADAANEAKGRFLAAMSHEIRTPLNGILGIAHLMKDDATAPEEVERADVLVGSAVALKTLVDDVLDHAKVEAGKLTLAPVEGDLRDVADAVVKLFQANAGDKGLWLRMQVEPSLPGRMVFDPVRVRQILSNLVSNAIKFTDKGGVQIKLGAASISDETVRVEAAVTDTGIGIGEASQAKLFRQFSQVDDHGERAAQGTGLGLSISQGLAELMGGSIDVRSDIGEGSVFTLRFDAEPTAPSEATETATNSAQDDGPIFDGIRILLVDDNASNRFIAKSFLKGTAAQIDEVTNGAQAVEQARQAKYDLILMDMHMPVMSGREAFERIRAGPAHFAYTPIVALTADGAPEDREALLNAGMDGYLSKPLSKAALLSELQRLLQSAPRQLSPSQTAAE